MPSWAALYASLLATAIATLPCAHFLLVAAVLEVASELALAGVEGLIEDDARADASARCTSWIIFTIGAGDEPRWAAAVGVWDGRIPDEHAGATWRRHAAVLGPGISPAIGVFRRSERRASRDRQGNQGHGDATHEPQKVPHAAAAAPGGSDFLRGISP